MKIEEKHLLLAYGYWAMAQNQSPRKLLVDMARNERIEYTAEEFEGLMDEMNFRYAKAWYTKDDVSYVMSQCLNTIKAVSDDIKRIEQILEQDVNTVGGDNNHEEV